MTTKTKIIISIALIGLTVAGRLLPHLWNMTPIVAATLFAGVYLGRNYVLPIILGSMLISDFVIGFDSLPMTISIYASFILIGAIGLLIKNYKSVTTVIASSITASTLFFLITNWAVWQFTSMYAKTFDGLMLSYTMAVPFYRNMLAGDLFYTAILFGLAEAVMYVRLKKMAQINNQQARLSQETF